MESGRPFSSYPTRNNLTGPSSDLENPLGLAQKKKDFVRVVWQSKGPASREGKTKKKKKKKVKNKPASKRGGKNKSAPLLIHS